MGRHLMVVMNNPLEGREDDYNDWYDNQHLDDVLRIPGVVCAQRFRLSPVHRKLAPDALRYMALYMIETDDLRGVLDQIKTRSGTELMPLTDAIGPDGKSFFFEPFGATADGPRGNE